jgi:hypothetical protein
MSNGTARPSGCTISIHEKLKQKPSTTFTMFSILEQNQRLLQHEVDVLIVNEEES